MTNPLLASHYADDALQATVEIVENKPIAQQTMRVRFRAAKIAARVSPGQFLMARLADHQDPLIGRALALYEVVDDDGRPEFVDLVYLVKGKFTSRLAEMSRGDRLVVWGPLGNGFSTETCDHLILVAGGIGYTPFLTVAQERLGLRTFARQRPAPRASRVTFCYGARTAALLAGVEQFERAGVDVQLATDDGAAGHHGLVTDLLKMALQKQTDSTRILCCGPEPMMAAVSAVAEQFETPCEVSLETPMACGVGICFTCVTKVKEAGGEWDYKRTCVEGPVFSADQIVW
ncbi:MAG: dihydroorotate dehydrogenase electron transfer subunit [Pirellulaceae bacterium]|jgi:dihydroorotate dehydrogenase electron transfer subunit|nr:dihydroorotate dehydrogenase electron transfer subunit [Pirellulaceae bacterium]